MIAFGPLPFAIFWRSGDFYFDEIVYSSCMYELVDRWINFNFVWCQLFFVVNTNVDYGGSKRWFNLVLVFEISNSRSNGFYSRMVLNDKRDNCMDK